MSEHHSRMASRSRIERELCNLMQHEQPELADLDNCGPRQVRRPFPSVHVSANDIGRRQVAQPIDDLRFSNVASVTCCPLRPKNFFVDVGATNLDWTKVR